MTTLEAVRDRLIAEDSVTDLVETKIYPQKVPQGIIVPYVVMTVVSEVPVVALHGTAESRLLNARVQVDSYAQTYAEAHAVAEAIDAVIANLEDHDLSAFREDMRDLYEEDTQYHRVSADYFVSR